MDTDVDLDLNTTTFMDAGAVGLLVVFRARVLEQTPKARIRLLNAAPIVRRILQMSRAEALFEFSP